MQIRVEVLLLLVLGTLHAGAGQAVKPQELARLPGAVLLTGYPPFELWMTAPGEILQLQPTAGNMRTGKLNTLYPRLALSGGGMWRAQGENRAFPCGAARTLAGARREETRCRRSEC